MARFAFNVGLHAYFAGSLLGNWVEPRGYGLALVSLEVLGKVVCLELLDYARVLAHHHVFLHVLLGQLANPSVLGALSPVDQVDPQLALFFLVNRTGLDKGVDNLLRSLGVVILEVVSGDTVNSHVLLVE